ncbi:MAG: iron-sulfur cluster assembly scaffold protein [Planctomycetota bacterium]
MVAESLRERARRGTGAGDCEGPDVVRGSAEHPVCGDRVELSLRVRDGVVQELRWRAAGCPAVFAVAALAAEALVAVPTARVADVLHEALAGHGGLASHERHAEAMVGRALRSALGNG